MAQILIVDDDTAVREVLYDLLTRKGYAVLTANSGQQAIEMMKTHRPQCVLLDTIMPGLSGLVTAKKIRVFDDAVPIAFLKAPGEPDLAPQELKRLGITEVVPKGLSVELFVKSLDVSLKRLLDGGKGHAAAGGVHMPGALLLVDDEPGILRLLKAFFESRGVRVATAGSGEEAVAAVTKKPLAVLLDMTMPGMDGLMTLKKIKTIHPNLPVIIVSGIGDEATIQEALDSGAYDYVAKPFNLEYLETVVLTKVLLGMEG